MVSHTTHTDIAKYIDAITSVRDKVKDVDLSSLPRTIVLMSHMYSNTKVPVPRFFLNEEAISRNNSLLIGYTCLNCKVANEITLNLFIRKIHNGVVNCNACKNSDETKRLEHAAYMRGERIVESVERWSEKSLETRIAESVSMFESEDGEFKRAYFNYHLTSEEFDNIRGKIHSIGHGKLTDISGWTYMPTYKIWNQTKYTPMLVNSSLNKIEKPNYITFKCETCDTLFTNRDIEIQKNRIKMLCAQCSFCNRTFKIKSMKTPWGKIRYQSVQERRFIQWCIEHNIVIENGPDIEYSWSERTHKYRVDFQLPEYLKLIELKDNHIWHKMQIKNGKWGAKEQCAKKWCDERGWSFDLLFPKTIASWKETILESRKI